MCEESLASRRKPFPSRGDARREGSRERGECVREERRRGRGKEIERERG